MMKTALRLTALAVVLGVAAFGASAAQIVTLDFEGLLSTADIDNKAPKKIEDTIQGFKFSSSNTTSGGVWAWRGNFSTSIDDPNFGDNPGSFLVNRNKSPSTTGKIVVDLVDPDRFITELTFQALFLNNPSVLGYEKNSSTGIAGQLTSGSGEWSPGYDGNGDPYPFGTPITFKNGLDLAKVVRLEFYSGDGGGIFGLDDLKITLSDKTSTGTAPEPGSFALVGLALLAAGAARRRV